MHKSDSGKKGVQMGRHPYLWRENNPAHPYADTPCENFVPTPEIDSGADDLGNGKVKKAVKIGLLVLFVAFMVYALIAQLIENPELFKLGDAGYKSFFR